MPTTLYLTPKEQSQLATVTAALRAQVTVETETLTYEDTDERRDARMRHLHLETPVLQEFQRQAHTLTLTPEELIAQAQTVDLSSISKHDAMELAFAWGPDVFTALIGEAIPLISTAQELQEVADLSDLRHGLLLSLSRSSSTPSA